MANTKTATASTADKAWRDKLKDAGARISRAGPPSDPDAKVEDGAIPPGGGSAPIENDPAVIDPLGHLDDLPGTTPRGEPPTPEQQAGASANTDAANMEETKRLYEDVKKKG